VGAKDLVLALGGLLLTLGIVVGVLRLLDTTLGIETARVLCVFMGGLLPPLGTVVGVLRLFGTLGIEGRLRLSGMGIATVRVFVVLIGGGRFWVRETARFVFDVLPVGSGPSGPPGTVVVPLAPTPCIEGSPGSNLVDGSGSFPPNGDPRGSGIKSGVFGVSVVVPTLKPPRPGAAPPPPPGVVGCPISGAPCPPGPGAAPPPGPGVTVPGAGGPMKGPAGPGAAGPPPPGVATPGAGGPMKGPAGPGAAGPPGPGVAAPGVLGAPGPAGPGVEGPPGPG